MEWFRAFKEKQLTQRRADIIRRSEEVITVSDLSDSLFIAYEGTPLIPIKAEWTSQDIIAELSKLRQNYINAKIKELC